MACGDRAREDHCHCRHVDFLIGSYPRLGKDALIQRIDKLDDATSQILEDQAILDNDLKTIGLHQEDYKARLQRMLPQQQGLVDKTDQALEDSRGRDKGVAEAQTSPNDRPGTRSRCTTGSCPGVCGKAGDDLEHSRRRIGAHGGSHGDAPL